MNFLLARSLDAAARFMVTIAACSFAIAQCVISSDAIGQSSDVSKMQKEIESLRAAQAAMVEDIKRIQEQLQRTSALPAAPAPVAGVELSLESAQFRGDRNARIVLVEFSDFQCPFCARYANSTFREIVRDYVDAGKVRYAFMNFPLESLHSLAFDEHVAAACAADQGRFWEMHDRLFADPRSVDGEALAAHAATIGLDTPSFRACVESTRHANEIREAMKLGNAIGVTGTPTFVIGMVEHGGKVKAMKIIAGAKPYSAFKDALDSVLSSKVASAPTAAGARLDATQWRRSDDAAAN